MRCWLPCEMRTITCTPFNHVPFLLLMSWHYVHQKWNSHTTWCCHCQSNMSGFISSILCNLKICCLWNNSSQKKELSQLTPH
jgi:hypothetical protein